MTPAPELGAFVVPSAGDLDDVLAQVRAVEDGGLELVGIQDHPYQRRFLDTFVLLAYLAARTERVRLFPDVANLPLRPPPLLAKAAASIDVLSGGRFELGLGAGAFWEAIAAMGGPVRSGPESVDALEAAIPQIRAFWRGEAVDGLKPGPAPAHDIGIWLGAYGPRMMRVVGRLADGWIPSIPRMPLEQVAERRRTLDAAADRAGRDPASIRRIANVNGRIVDGPVNGYLDGPPEHWVEALSELAADHGFDGFIIWSGEPMVEQIGRLARDVAPALRGGRPSA